MRFSRRIFTLMFFLVVTAFFSRPASAQSNFPSTAVRISITDCGPPCDGSGAGNSGFFGPTAPNSYPVPIVVSGFTGSVEAISITLKHIIDPSPVTGLAYFGFSNFLLVSPDGRAFAFLVSGCNTDKPINNGSPIDLTFADSGSNSLQSLPF